MWKRDPTRPTSGELSANDRGGSHQGGQVASPSISSLMHTDTFQLPCIVSEDRVAVIPRTPDVGQFGAVPGSSATTTGLWGAHPLQGCFDLTGEHKHEHMYRTMAPIPAHEELGTHSSKAWPSPLNVLGVPGTPQPMRVQPLTAMSPHVETLTSPVGAATAYDAAGVVAVGPSPHNSPAIWMLRPDRGQPHLTHPPTPIMSTVTSPDEVMLRDHRSLPSNKSSHLFANACDVETRLTNQVPIIGAKVPLEPTSSHWPTLLARSGAPPEVFGSGSHLCATKWPTDFSQMTSNLGLGSPHLAPPTLPSLRAGIKPAETSQWSHPQSSDAQFQSITPRLEAGPDTSAANPISVPRASRNYLVLNRLQYACLETSILDPNSIRIPLDGSFSRKRWKRIMGYFDLHPQRPPFRKLTWRGCKNRLIIAPVEDWDAIVKEIHGSTLPAPQHLSLTRTFKKLQEQYQTRLSRSGITYQKCREILLSCPCASDSSLCVQCSPVTSRSTRAPRTPPHHSTEVNESQASSDIAVNRVRGCSSSSSLDSIISSPPASQEFCDQQNLSPSRSRLPYDPCRP